jgi:protein phosphatase
MTEQNNNLTAAAVSDRGLSEKRPLNEDSYLCDPARRLFAVADGVGGAQAGEVASQTAMEVLDEAFRHQTANSDHEDLMEIAIQRANSSIHSMSREHPKLSRMATTIVALHLDGNMATIGHVGDSRLYRLSPGGQLFRETRDHSVVEEEVRAGRMTTEQAAHHPSRNVISRALGAEEGVEVDLKTLEVTPGTAFLLCSDGITRHIPDDEIQSHLNAHRAPAAICEEMKRICYERGAEDNLTAIVVRLTDPNHPIAEFDGDEERTVSTARMANTLETPVVPEPVPTPVAVVAAEPVAPPVQTAVVRPAAVKQRGFFGRLVHFIFWLIVVLAFGAAAFLAGLYIQRTRPNNTILTSIVPTPAAEPPADLNSNHPQQQLPVSTVDADRREVDRDPAGMAAKLAAQKPLEGTDPVKAYLYGRALMLTGNYPGATAAFKKAGELLAGQQGQESIKVDNALSALAAATKANDEVARRLALNDLDQVMRQISTPAAGAPTGATPTGAAPAPPTGLQ